MRERSAPWPPDRLAVSVRLSSPASPMTRHPALLVRRTDVDSIGTHAGRFAPRSLLPRRGPSSLVRTLGVLCADTTEPVFALTYDDGPDPDHTPPILDVLAAHGARATFFVMTGRAIANRALIERIIAEGHEVQLHGRDHRSMLTRGFRECRRHLVRAKRELASLGVRATLYRPPYLQFRARQMFAVRSLGLTLALASGDSRDWEHDAEESVAMRGAAAVFPGAVLLMHDSRADPETARSADELPRFDRAAVLDLLLRESTARGLQAVTMTELLRRAPVVVARAYHRSL